MYKTLNEYFNFPDGDLGGLFSYILNITNFPLVDTKDIDLYFFLHHGEKLGSKILDFFTDTDGHLTEEGLVRLGEIIHNKYINNWEHEYKTLTVEYNPIENTDFTETVTDRSSSSGTSNGTSGGSSGTTGDVYGFNSGSAVHDNKTDTTASSTNSSGFSNTGANDREIRKHGNIGVTTNADMIKSDIEVWRLNNFYDILCSDVCKEIALSIF